MGDSRRNCRRQAAGFELLATQFGERVVKVVVGRPEGDRPHITPRRASENNIKMERGRMSYGVDWINQAHVGRRGGVV